jgi:uncharacterized protein (DUF2062 family)
LVFKRRNPRSYARTFREFFYPTGGWFRALVYILHRLRRLPDAPHRIARGVGVGVFISFSPLFGLHFVLCTAINWLIGGNFLASVIGNWFGNPVTLPLIAWSSVRLGQWILRVPDKIDLHALMQITTDMSVELWRNCFALFTPARMDWTAFGKFAEGYFVPYLIGGLILGAIFSVASHALTWRVVEAYRRLRTRRLAERRERRRAAMAAAAAREHRSAGRDRPDGLA